MSAGRFRFYCAHFELLIYALGNRDEVPGELGKILNPTGVYIVWYSLWNDLGSYCVFFSLYF